MHLVKFTVIEDEIDEASIWLNPMAVTWFSADPDNEKNTVVHLSSRKSLLVKMNLSDVFMAIDKAMGNGDLQNVE